MLKRHKMKRSRCFFCLIFTLSLIHVTVSQLCETTVQAKLHQRFTLTCEHDCTSTGKNEWNLLKDREVVLVQCNRTSCSSLMEGFDVSTDDYKRGSPKLIITDPDYSKRNVYVYECGDSDRCRQQLIIEPVLSVVQIEEGEDLKMKLPIDEPMELKYQRNPHSKEKVICTMKRMNRSSLWCESDYRDRVHLIESDLILRSVSKRDSGVYTTRDKQNDQNIHIYSLSVSFPVWKIVLIVLVLVFFIISVVICYLNRDRILIWYWGQKTGVDKVLDQCRTLSDLLTLKIDLSEMIEKLKEVKLRIKNFNPQFRRDLYKDWSSRKLVDVNSFIHLFSNEEWYSLMVDVQLFVHQCKSDPPSNDEVNKEVISTCEDYSDKIQRKINYLNKHEEEFSDSEDMRRYDCTVTNKFKDLYKSIKDLYFKAAGDITGVVKLLEECEREVKKLKGGEISDYQEMVEDLKKMNQKIHRFKPESKGDLYNVWYSDNLSDVEDFTLLFSNKERNRPEDHQSGSEVQRFIQDCRAKEEKSKESGYRGCKKLVEELKDKKENMTKYDEEFSSLSLPDQELFIQNKQHVDDLINFFTSNEQVLELMFDVNELLMRFRNEMIEEIPESTLYDLMKMEMKMWNLKMNESVDFYDLWFMKNKVHVHSLILFSSDKKWYTDVIEVQLFLHQCESKDNPHSDDEIMKRCSEFTVKLQKQTSDFNQLIHLNDENPVRIIYQKNLTAIKQLFTKKVEKTDVNEVLKKFETEAVRLNPDKISEYKKMVEDLEDVKKKIKEIKHQYEEDLITDWFNRNMCEVEGFILLFTDKQCFQMVVDAQRVIQQHESEITVKDLITRVEDLLPKVDQKIKESMMPHLQCFTEKQKIPDNFLKNLLYILIDQLQFIKHEQKSEVLMLIKKVNKLLVKCTTEVNEVNPEQIVKELKKQQEEMKTFMLKNPGVQSQSWTWKNNRHIDHLIKFYSNTEMVVEVQDFIKQYKSASSTEKKNLIPRAKHLLDQLKKMRDNLNIDERILLRDSDPLQQFISLLTNITKEKPEEENRTRGKNKSGPSDSSTVIDVDADGDDGEMIPLNSRT